MRIYHHRLFSETPFFPSVPRSDLNQPLRSVVQENQQYIPIHHQVLNWGMSDAVGTEVSPEDDPKFKFFTMN